MANREIKAIETEHNGNRMRSRLEARWATFFDEMSVKWAYEPETFDLGDTGWYLPDFEFTGTVQPTYVEIKPHGCPASEFRATWAKAKVLAMGEKARVLLVQGDPYLDEYVLWMFAPDDWAGAYTVEHGRFAECRRCDGIWIEQDDFGAQAILCSCERAKKPSADGPRISAAYRVARNSHFGELRGLGGVEV